MYEVKEIGNHRIIFADSEGVYRSDEGLRRKGQPDSKLYYWCNSMGEVNLPDGQPRAGWPDELEHLPSNVRAIYENYHEETDWMHMYIARFDGVDGVLFTLLIDDNWVKEAGGDISSVFHVMKIVAADIERLNPLFQHCDIFALDRTDPIGSEMAFFFPPTELDSVREFKAKTKELAEMIYGEFYSCLSYKCLKIYKCVKDFSEDTEILCKAGNTYIALPSCVYNWRLSEDVQEEEERYDIFPLENSQASRVTKEALNKHFVLVYERTC